MSRKCSQNKNEKLFSVQM